MLLLTLLEGFSLDRAARVLALSVTEARGRLARACVALQDLCIARVLVIEDKKSLADDLGRCAAAYSLTALILIKAGTGRFRISFVAAARMS